MRIALNIFKTIPARCKQSHFKLLNVIHRKINTLSCKDAEQATKDAEESEFLSGGRELKRHNFKPSQICKDLMDLLNSSLHYSFFFFFFLNNRKKLGLGAL